MKTYTLAGAFILLSCLGLFAQSGMKIHSGGAVTVNGNTSITPSGFQCGTPLTDTRDGKIYSTVLIGTQCWMKSNLNYGTRIDGTVEQTNNNIAEKYCYENLESNCTTYGGLYRWNEAMQYSTTEGAKGICPAGWHLPTDAEWTTLTSFLGGETLAGGKLKEAGTTHWVSPNEGATNSCGFTALPGGYCLNNGASLDIGNYGYFWNSTENDTNSAWARGMSSDYGDLDIFNSYKPYGFSVRCIKD